MCLVDSFRKSLDLLRERDFMSHSLSRDLLRLFFRLELATFSKMASRDLER